MSFAVPSCSAMAARSRAIEARLERMVPAMEEFFIAGIVTGEEKASIARARLNHEYKLVARPLLLLDVQNALHFEMELERSIERFAASGNKLKLKHRWSVLDRIESLYRIAIPRLSEAEKAALEADYLRFLERHDRQSTLSRYVAEQVAKFPEVEKYWLLASKCERATGNFDHARATIQRAVQKFPRSGDVWSEALEVELEFANQALTRIQKDSANEGRKAEVLMQENAALASILLNLELCQAVIDAGLNGPAFESFLSTLSSLRRFPFAKDLATASMTAISKLTTPRNVNVVLRGLIPLIQNLGDSSWRSPREFIEDGSQKQRPTSSLISELDIIDCMACTSTAARQVLADILCGRARSGLLTTREAELSNSRFLQDRWTPGAVQLPAVQALAEITSVQPHEQRDLVAELRKCGVLPPVADSWALICEQISRGETAAAEKELTKNTPTALSDWRFFECQLLLQGTGRKRTQPDDDDEAAGTFPTALKAIAFVQRFSQALLPRQEQGKWDEALTAATELVVRSACADGLREPFAQIDLGRLPAQIDAGQRVKIVQLLAKTVQVLESSTGRLVRPLTTVVLPALLNLHTGSGAAATNIINVARKCYERAMKEDSSLCSQYADFELRVAKRPDLAQQVKRTFGRG
jgi:tetratricopeptide (TPR) repeat protein